MEEIVQAFFNAEIAQAALPIVLAGLLNTVLLSLLVVPLGFAGGMILALLAQAKSPLVRWPLMAWVDFFRAFPPLVLLVLLFAGLPFAGLELGGFACVAIAFFLNTGAYYGEIFRAGIDSVPAGQVEAGRSTGLSRLQALTYIVLPQAVRNVLPALLNDFVSLQKDTAIVSILGVAEAVHAGQIATGVEFNYSAYATASLLYLLVTVPLTRYTDRIMAKDRRQRLAVAPT